MMSAEARLRAQHAHAIGAIEAIWRRAMFENTLVVKHRAAEGVAVKPNRPAGATR